MPKKRPSLGREPVQKVRNYEQSVKRTRLLCTKFHELIRLFHPAVSICSHILPIIPMLMLYSRELFEFASLIQISIVRASLVNATNYSATDPLLQIFAPNCPKEGRCLVRSTCKKNIHLQTVDPGVSVNHSASQYPHVYV